MIRRPPRSTRTDTLFPYTTLFRSLLRAAALADREAEVGFGGVDFGGHVVTVERQARFEPQRIARAEADGLYFFHRAERIGKGGEGFARQRNLEAVLAGVARAADADRHAVPVIGAHLHEDEFAHRRPAGLQRRQTHARQRIRSAEHTSELQSL